METLFITAFGMSIVFAVQPGVIAIESLRRGLKAGFKSALNVELGSLVGDATWACVALIGASFLFQSRLIALVFGLFGCFLLLRFAWDTWSSHEEAKTVTINHEQPAQGVLSQTNAFMAGVMLSLSNPQNLTFWLGMSGIIAGLGFLTPQPAHFIIFFSGFMLGQLSWCFFYAAVVSCGRRYLNPAVVRVINFASVIFMGYLGISLFVQTLRNVL